MPFNGSGTFVPLAAPDFPAVAGNLIEATKFNNNLQDIFVQGLSKCIVKDGQSTITGNLPMSGFKHTGVANAVAQTEYAAFGQVAGLRGALGIVDWDTVILTGIYEGEATSLTAPSTNFPPTSELGQLQVLAQGAAIVHMYVFPGGLATRSKVSGTWSSWNIIEFVSENLVVNVPADYATFELAWASLANKRVTGDNTMSIHLATGIHNVAASVFLNHPDGHRINITGDGIGLSLLQVNTSSPGFDMLIINDGNTFGSIEGVTLTLNSRAFNTNTRIALRIEDGAKMLNFDAEVTNWARGIDVSTGAVFNVQNASLSLHRDYGIQVRNGASIFALTVDVSDVTDSTANTGSGIYILDGSFGNIAFVSSTLCRIAGVHVANASLLHVGQFSDLDGNTGAGAIVDGCSLASFGNSVSFDSNGANGIVCQNGAQVFLNDCDALSNTGSGLVVSSGGVATLNSGNYNSNTRYGVEIINAQVPTMSSVTTTGNTIGGISSGQSIYNDPTSGTGLTPVNANSDVLITPTGTGKVRFGTHAAVGAETITGYIEIKDAGGTVRKLAVIS